MLSCHKLSATHPCTCSSEAQTQASNIASALRDNIERVAMGVGGLAERVVAAGGDWPMLLQQRALVEEAVSWWTSVSEGLGGRRGGVAAASGHK